LEALERPQQRAIRRAARREARPIDGREQRRADYAQILTALRADSFDTAAVSEILERQARDLRRLQTGAQSKWLEIVTEMSRSERRAYAERLEEVLQRRTRRGKPRD
ncbi:MAG: hypothetical protein P1U53_04600, partial [Sulfitobacter sp.]|nr:hypothetical protein [Sulfitobacter sp.]